MYESELHSNISPTPDSPRLYSKLPTVRNLSGRQSIPSSPSYPAHQPFESPGIDQSARKTSFSSHHSLESHGENLGRASPVSLSQDRAAESQDYYVGNQTRAARVGTDSPHSVSSSSSVRFPEGSPAQIVPSSSPARLLDKAMIDRRIEEIKRKVNSRSTYWNNR